jgi:hypothetical protein
MDLTMTWDQLFVNIDWSKFIDNAEKVSKICAIIIAGLWAYFNFFRGRIYRPRLEPKILYKIFNSEGRYYLIAIIQAKNVGLSKIVIKQEGTGLRVLIFNQSTSMQKIRGIEIEWDHIQTLSVFENHEWIEPGETIEEQKIIAVSEHKDLAFKLELRLVSNKTSWGCMTIVSPSVKDP